MNDSSSPLEGRFSTANVSIVGDLMMPLSWTPSSKNKIVPTKSILSEDEIPYGEIKVNRHNIIAPAPCQENLQDGKGQDRLGVKVFKLSREMVLNLLSSKGEWVQS